MRSDPSGVINALEGELDNFILMARALLPEPSDVPAIDGIEVAGSCLPLNGRIGGDHIIYIDFNKRYDLPARIQQALARGRNDVAAELERDKTRAGVLIADGAGHSTTDGFLVGMLHQAFLTGVLYELEYHGTITPEVFEHLSVRFYNSTSITKYVAMLYGEMEPSGRFRFISAGHEVPVVFSYKYERFMEIGRESLRRYPPVGMMPFEEHIDRARIAAPLLGYKPRYEVSEINLMGVGDVLLLYSDGLSEHENGGRSYAAERLEKRFREFKDRPLTELVDFLSSDIREFGPPADDISFVFVRRTH